MSKWLSIMKQRGKGCDYTIGCGLTVLEVEAPSLEKAKEIIIKQTRMDEYQLGHCDPQHYIDVLEYWKIIKIEEETDMLLVLKQWNENFKQNQEP